MIEEFGAETSLWADVAVCCDGTRDVLETFLLRWVILCMLLLSR